MTSNDPKSFEVEFCEAVGIDPTTVTEFMLHRTPDGAITLTVTMFPTYDAINKLVELTERYHITAIIDTTPPDPWDTAP